MFPFISGEFRAASFVITQHPGKKGGGDWQRHFRKISRLPLIDCIAKPAKKPALTILKLHKAERNFFFFSRYGSVYRLGSRKFWELSKYLFFSHLLRVGFLWLQIPLFPLPPPPSPRQSLATELFSSTVTWQSIEKFTNDGVCPLSYRGKSFSVSLFRDSWERDGWRKAERERETETERQTDRQIERQRQRDFKWLRTPFVRSAFCCF